MGTLNNEDHIGIANEMNGEMFEHYTRQYIDVANSEKEARDHFYETQTYRVREIARLRNRVKISNYIHFGCAAFFLALGVVLYFMGM